MKEKPVPALLEDEGACEEERSSMKLNADEALLLELILDDIIEGAVVDVGWGGIGLNDIFPKISTFVEEDG